MAKNEYKSAVNYFKLKSNSRLILANDGQHIYISSDHIMMRLTIQDYALYFHNEHPEIYPVLKPGDIVDSLELFRDPAALAERFNRHNDQERGKAIITDYCRYIDGDGSKKHLARLVLSGDPNARVSVLINDKFIKAFDFMDNAEHSGRANDALSLFSDRLGCAAIICPIRNEKDPYKEGDALSGVM